MDTTINFFADDKIINCLNVVKSEKYIEFLTPKGFVIHQWEPKLPEELETWYAKEKHKTSNHLYEFLIESNIPCESDNMRSGFVDFKTKEIEYDFEYSKLLNEKWDYIQKEIKKGNKNIEI